MPQALLFAHLYSRAVHVTSVTDISDIATIASARDKKFSVTCGVDVDTLLLTTSPSCNQIWQHFDDVDVISIGSSTLDLSKVVPMLLGSARKHGYAFSDVIDKLSTNPQAIFGIPPQDDTYSEIELSGDATDADGRPIAGRITRTVVRGDVAFLDGKVFVNSGEGEHLAPTVRAKVDADEAQVDRTAVNEASTSVAPDTTQSPRLDGGAPKQAASTNFAMPVVPEQPASITFANQLVSRGLLHLTGEHVLNVGRFDRDSTHHLFNIAHDIRFAHASNYSDLLKGRVIATIFYEPSTRTHCSFQAAMQRLGGTVIPLDKIESTSVKKGESFSDFIRTMCSYVDAIVLRHPAVGSVEQASIPS